MISVSRYPKNPILVPTPENPWEAHAAFNGSVIKKDGRYELVYRAMSNKQKWEDQEFEVSVIGKAKSTNGTEFTDHEIFIKPQNEWEKYGCEDPRVCCVDNTYFIFYTALSKYPFEAEGIKAAVAISKDFFSIDEK